MSVANYTKLKYHFAGDYWGPGTRTYDASYFDSFEQHSLSHAGWRNLGGGSTDTGGPWFMTKTTHDISASGCAFVNGPAWAEAVSGHSGIPVIGTEPALASVLNAFGTKAISLVAPTNPSFNTAQAIGELRMEGVPAVSGAALYKEKTRFLRGSGSEYLNVEFGWKPLVSDLHDFARTVINTHKVIEGYHKGSDKKIRRRYTVPPVYEQKRTEGTVWLEPIGPWATISDRGGATYDTSEVSSWFSGAFRYHVPMGDDLMSKLARYKSDAGKLLGLRLTPDTVWNLSPWSWAADWFANTGDVLTNISNLSQDGLVMQYGYSMQSTKWERSTEWGPDPLRPVSGGRYRKTVESKNRIPASPYGFGLTFDGLSDRQKAICVAIGLTRGK